MNNLPASISLRFTELIDGYRFEAHSLLADAQRLRERADRIKKRIDRLLSADEQQR